jgi:hypothetical protein
VDAKPASPPSRAPIGPKIAPTATPATALITATDELNDLAISCIFMGSADGPVQEITSVKYKIGNLVVEAGSCSWNTITGFLNIDAT